MVQGLAKVWSSKESLSGNPASSTFKIHLQFHPCCDYLVWLTLVLTEITTAIPASFLAPLSSDIRYKLGPLKCGMSSLCKCFLYTLIKTHPSRQGAPVRPTLWPPPCSFHCRSTSLFAPLWWQQPSPAPTSPRSTFPPSSGPSLSLTSH